MHSTLGNMLVDRLGPSNKPYEVRDTRLKGFLLRVQPSGVKTYYLEYARGKRVKIGRADAIKPAAARERAKQVIAEAYQGKDPAAERRAARAFTYGRFLDERYAPWAAANIRTHEATVKRLKRTFTCFHHTRLGEITPWAVEKWRLARFKTGAKATTVNRDLDDLKSSLGKAVQWGLLEANPLFGVRRSKVDANRTARFLSRSEERALRTALDDRESRIRRERTNANRWRRNRRYPLLPDLDAAAFADHLKPMVLLSLNTGLRQGELFQLEWSSVDLERALLTVIGLKAKNGQTRHIPLNEEAGAILRRWKDMREKNSRLVFPGKTGKPFNNIRRAWMGVLTEAGVEKFRWHDLRHSFASNLVMASVDLNTVRELLGHADLQMTLRYAHLAPDHKADAVRKLGHPGTVILDGQREYTDDRIISRSAV